LQYEKEFPPADMKRYADLGVVRITLGIGDDKFLNTYETSDSIKKMYKKYRYLNEERNGLN
jgi:hypothetical protein